MFAATTLNTISGLSGIAQIVSALAIAIGFYQIFFAARDSRIKYLRESRQYALTQAEKFAEEIIPKYAALDEIFQKNKISWPNKLTKTPLIGDINELRTKNVDIQKVINFISFNSNINAEINLLINKLESFAICFVGGVGDEKMIFSSVGGLFCTMVNKYHFYYLIIKDQSKDLGNGTFENTLALFNMWNGKLKKGDIENKMRELAKDLESVNVDEIKPVGTK
ncbi:MAG: hypothetical protein V4469_03905 [Patescibacteria group bacterium]